MYKYKFAIDTDSLIKLTKTSIIEKICENFNCVITKEVYDEAVTQGKLGLYQDSYQIEKLIKSKLITVNKREIEKMQLRASLGEGEKSLFALYKNSKGMIIVSDDNMFINFLREEKTKFIIPVSFITLLKSLNKIDSKQALTYLNKMKPYIKLEVYSKIKNNFGGEK